MLVTTPTIDLVKGLDQKSPPVACVESHDTMVSPVRTANDIPTAIAPVENVISDLRFMDNEISTIR